MTIKVKKRKKGLPLPIEKIKTPSPGELPLTYLYTYMYLKGTSTEEIATIFGKAKGEIKGEITRLYKTLRETLETEDLIALHKIDMKSSKAKSLSKRNIYKHLTNLNASTNEKFLEMLSDPNSSILSQEEMNFVYLLVHEGNELKALEDSKLSVGLSCTPRGEYTRNCKLRCMMLKGKKNIIKAINRLQIDYAKELDISKETIQTEIIRQLSQLKEQNDPKLAPTIAKLTEQLGRTIGAFTDKVSVEEVSFDQAMDKMLEMRKANASNVSTENKKSLETNSEPTTFVYDPDKIG